MSECQHVSMSACLLHLTPPRYSFYAYDRVKQGKKRLRVSQVLILPPYQRHGYGRFLYKAICSRACEDELVQDITVEDPNADFSRLRDVCGMHKQIHLCSVHIAVNSISRSRART